MSKMITGLAITSVVAISAMYFVKENASTIVKCLDKLRDRLQALAEQQSPTYDCVGDGYCGYTCDDCPNHGVTHSHSEE